MTQLADNIHIESLNPEHFALWTPPEDRCVHVGAEQDEVSLPALPLPLNCKDVADYPTDNAIGNGIYDYLRQFPDCPYASDYASLLRDAYPHFLADLGAQVVMLDHKDVEPSYILRKLSYLKILRLLEPENAGLLWQLCQGYYGLAMTFTELPQVQKHLLDTMRFGQALLKIKENDAATLNLLAEVDVLFGDYPGAISKFQKLLPQIEDEELHQRVESRLAACVALGFPDHPLMDDLERCGEAMMLYASGEYPLATEILERLETDDYFMSEFVSADFFCLLGMGRLKTDDMGGAFESLTKSLEIDPDHQQARELIDSI
ncbi:MAG: hypothetical protein OET90_04140 [Desulfuromonadales bacterium]|nr:hypothetical protein [Desulfuromonadales bacterium]